MKKIPIDIETFFFRNQYENVYSFILQSFMKMKVER